MSRPTTTVRLPFGHSNVAVQVPTSCLLGVFEPTPIAGSHDETALVQEALRSPIGSPRLRDLARPGQKVTIVTSDLTRPCPSGRLLPHVLDELAQAGVVDRNVMVVVALGLHRPMTEAELAVTVGPEVFRRVRVINHDPADTVRLGTTSAGTPVELLRAVVEADLRICIGNVEFHYFVGYSGGAKAIIPGCSSEATIRANHAMMTHPDALAGRLQGNPVRVDLEEGVSMVGVDFVLNVLVDGDHHILAAVAGDVTVAHRRGCAMVAERGRINIPALADIVLVSAGGYPKDVNLYQAQKALDNAANAVREGGIIILAAECKEGCGNRTFEDWMTHCDSPNDLLERIQQEFVLGGHKAAAIAKVAQKARIFLVSPPMAGVPLTGMRHFPGVQQVLDYALDSVGSAARVTVLPQGASVLPELVPS